MNKLFICFAEGIYDRLDGILTDILGEKQEILRTANGKPYIDGNRVYFSLSHSGKYGIIAVNDKPMGVDLETYKNKDHGVLVNRFSERERAEINCENDFLRHWTAREAFIKMTGGTLAEDYKKLEFFDGNIYYQGKKQPCTVQAHNFKFGVVSVCFEN